MLNKKINLGKKERCSNCAKFFSTRSALINHENSCEQNLVHKSKNCEDKKSKINSNEDLNEDKDTSLNENIGLCEIYSNDDVLLTDLPNNSSNPFNSENISQFVEIVIRHKLSEKAINDILILP